MENMMRSLARLVIDNAGVLGLTADDVHLVLNPKRAPIDDVDADARRRSLTLNHLRTEEDEEETAFDNTTTVWPDGEVDFFRTVFEILVECRQLQADAGRDYYPNEARLLAEKVRAFYRGPGNTGRRIDRVAWDKSGTPIEGQGVAKWLRTDPLPQDKGDPIHIVVLTYELTWWAPAPTA